MVTGAPPVVTGGIFFGKIICELWKIIENSHFIMESEGYLNFQKFTSALKKFCTTCTRVAMKALLLALSKYSRTRQNKKRQNKQITKADSAEVNAGVSTKLIQGHNFCTILYTT